MRLVLMGPPGAGKGTQAVLLAERLGVPAISTGDIFRANVGGLTALGREAKRYIDAGDYVPDRVTNDMVRDRLAQSDARYGWLLDGYPRTPAQADELDRLCRDCGQTLDLVIVLGVPDQELVRRLLERAASEGRSDDTEAVITHRQQVFREQTEQLMATYHARGILKIVDGRGDVADVNARCLIAAGRPPGLGRSSHHQPA